MPVLSTDEGKQLAHDWMASLKAGFAANDFSPSYHMYAKQMSWDWSGDVKVQCKTNHGPAAFTAS